MKQFSKELGKVSITPKGDWNSSIANERLDIVYDRRNNQAYIAKQDVPIGVDIDNREYWQPLNVSGYADNNFINLTAENENGTITAYESLEEAVATIFPINRRVGATLSFYNLNSDRLDRQAEFELWQFNSTDLANWENKDYWNNIYYNWNVFAGWYIDADALNNHVEIPNVGQYAYVGSNLNDALLYQCRTNGTWTNTGIKVRNYISVVVSGNITIGENGNWFSDGEDTGIPATPSVDEQIDNIITKHESLSRTVQGIAATGGASTATNVTYNNDASGLTAENAQDAIDEVSSIGHFAKRGGIVNISTNYNSINTAEVLTLAQALSKVPSTDRVLGFQGKYLATDDWHTIIYIGDSLTSWSDTTKWIDLSYKILRSISNNFTFAGLKIVAFGDSVTEGKVDSASDSSARVTWVKTLAKMIGSRYIHLKATTASIQSGPYENIVNYDVFNMGSSGMRITYKKDGSTVEEWTDSTQIGELGGLNTNNVLYNWFRRFEMLNTKDGKRLIEPDIFIIAAGTSDVSQGSDKGEISDAFNLTANYPNDLDTLDNTKMTSALKRVLLYIQINYPKAKIYYCTPTHGGYGGRTLQALRDVSNKNAEVCGYMNVEVIDLFRKSGINGIFENQQHIDAGNTRDTIDGVNVRQSGADKQAKTIFNVCRATY